MIINVSQYVVASNHPGQPWCFDLSVEQLIGSTYAALFKRFYLRQQAKAFLIEQAGGLD